MDNMSDEGHFGINGPPATTFKEYGHDPRYNMLSEREISRYERIMLVTKVIKVIVAKVIKVVAIIIVLWLIWNLLI